MANGRRLLTGLLLIAASGLIDGCDESPAAAAPTVPLAPIQLTVDAREPAAGRIGSHLTIPAHAGELRLVYPKWVPGEHAPDGPITDVVDLRVTAGGKPLAWRRNQDDMFEIIVTVPAGVSAIDLDFQALRTASGNFGGSAGTSARFVDIVWNQAVFYPRGARASSVVVEPTVKLPKGWSYGTALQGASEHDGAVSFAKVSIEQLVDSPLLAGAYVKTFDLGTVHGVPHSLTAVAENAEALAAPADEIEGWKRLVVEANALFGARHYDGYRFLVLLSDNISWFGLEHHQSSEDYMKERTLTDPDTRRIFDTLLSHEYVHSWNGKYRRPRGLATPDFQEPMRGDLLWVYEGLTQYLGWVLATRSGQKTVDDAKTALANIAAALDIPGRTWRPLADTTAAAQLLYSAPDVGGSQRRSTDFYDEGLLIWLEADVLIRQKTSGARSLDDFCKAFHGGKDSSPEVRPYDLDEVVKTLNAVAPNDWKAFFDERIYRVAPKVPVQGILGAGYKLATSDKKPDRNGISEKVYKYASYWQTLGFYVNEDNVVQDVLAGGPAANAGMTAKMKVLAADGKKLSSESMSEAVLHAKTAPVPLELLVERDGYYRTLKVDYHGGERYSVLERDAAKPDVLAAILAPTAK